MNKIITIKNSIKDYIFPIFCITCSKEGFWICDICFEKIKPKIFIANFGRRAYISRHLHILEYSNNSAIKKLIRTLKYNFVEDIYIIIDKIIKKNLYYNYFSDIDYIVPVPLHNRRYAERGFNQSELISNTLQKCINKRVLKNVLIRKKYTKIQARLKKEERIKNIKNAFEVNDDSLIKGKKILLVDDVFTTGSTIQECAKVLTRAGVREVCSFTVARGR